jgi:hypothetical protein
MIPFLYNRSAKLTAIPRRDRKCHSRAYQNDSKKVPFHSTENGFPFFPSGGHEECGSNGLKPAKLGEYRTQYFVLVSQSGIEIIRRMKKYNYPICGLLIVALAYFTFSGCQTTTTTGPSGSTAHLTVSRGAKFGTRSILAVMVDGARVASLTEGQAYNGSLSPGQHVISVSASGPSRGTAPQKTITAQAGQTYSFTATWQGKHLVLE